MRFENVRNLNKKEKNALLLFSHVCLILTPILTYNKLFQIMTEFGLKNISLFITERRITF